MKILERDEQGHIIKNSLSSEEAKVMSAAGNEARRRNSVEAIRQRADELLKSLGIEDGWEGAKEELRLLAEKYVLKGDSSTMTLLLKQTGNLVKTEKTDSFTENWDPEGGDPCPLCGGVRVTIALDNESAGYVAGIFNAPNLEVGTTGPVEGRENGGRSRA